MSVGIESELDYVKIGLRRLQIAAELDGERLLAPSKNYVRRNGGRARAPASKQLAFDQE
jgi:site-specific DNA-methyltransferase (adenine-specific)